MPIILNRLIPLALPLLLASCTTPQVWYKGGVPTARASTDLLNCRVSATQRVPVNTQTRVTPIIQNPIFTHCDEKGCRTYGGGISGGEAYSYDVNADLRDEVVAQCMSGQGYQPVSLPVCTSDQIASGLSERQPNLRTGDKACAYIAGNAWYIVKL